MEYSLKDLLDHPTEIVARTPGTYDESITRSAAILDQVLEWLKAGYSPALVVEIAEELRNYPNTPREIMIKELP